MMKKTALLLTLTILVNWNSLFGQAILENKLNFADAESWILFEDYNEALQIYLRLLRIYPTNSNIKYRIGQCYVNIPGQKGQAIPYLEDAVKNINPKYKEGRLKETGAPYDALYYLANAYRVNNQFDKAIETYNLFLKNLDNKLYDTAVVNQQIQSIRNAQALSKTPLYLRKTNLGTNINENYSEYNPVVSDDESVMVFTKALTFYNGLMYSTRTGNGWSPPINLNELLQIDVGRDIFPTSISSDGKTLYLYGSENYDGVIFTSTFSNGTWGTLTRLNENINTKFWESHATISHDNKKLYFTSNRKGTIGGLDIYVSERDSTGDWGVPVNLGPVINTKANEETPFLSNDDKTLFFSSRGHFNIGGYDIFYSTLMDNGQWSVPLNAGFPLNTTDDDVFFRPMKDGYEGYIAGFDTTGYGLQDIFRVEMFSDQHPRKFIVHGIAKIADLIGNTDEKVRITAVNTGKPDQVSVVYSNPKTGEYILQLPQGDYQVIYESPDGEKVVKTLNLAINNPTDTLLMGGTLLPKTDFTADLFIDSNREISVNKGDTIAIPIKAEPGSVVTIEHWIGDSLVYSETVPAGDSLFTYKTVLAEGVDKITFRSTDKYSNTTTAEILITPKPEVTEEKIARPEYNRVISSKQIAALAEIQKNLAGEDLKKVIEMAQAEKQQFGKVDDLVAYIKEKAAEKKISPEEVDVLMLRVARENNVLTQSAVDMLAQYATGDLKQILEGLDIYEQNLKTWTDLENYIARKSGGEVRPGDLNFLADSIISGSVKTIPVLKDKILAYSENTETGPIVTKSVDITDKKGITRAGAWLQSVTNEAMKLGMTSEQAAKMLAAVSTMSDEQIEKFITELRKFSDDPMENWLTSLDIRKENFQTPEDLIQYLISRKSPVPEESVYNSLTKNIIATDVPVSDIKERASQAGKERKTWFIWLILGAGIIFIIIFFLRKKKKDNRQNKQI